MPKETPLPQYEHLAIVFSSYVCRCMDSNVDSNRNKREMQAENHEKHHIAAKTSKNIANLSIFL